MVNTDGIVARSLSSADQSSGHSSSGGGYHGHPHDALFFLFNALVIGVGVLHLQMVFPKVQQTVVLFILGICYSLLIEKAGLKDSTGILGYSYEMWMHIDPHLLLFTMLPALLAGDAMQIDTSVASRVSRQCLYLAGPGVLFCSMVTAAFLSLYLGWSFLLSLVAGSILCATDPVAVVALLKELGASPVLTVQIQGESLANDGTAIVVFLIAYDMLSGNDYDIADISMVLVKQALLACALGLFIGYVFFTWIRAASNRFNHSSSMIQISLTICCAYWSFIMVEGVLKLSGILATVASSLVLARHMWPYIVKPESLQHVWHTIETLGNTIVFFLAGSLTGSVVADTEYIDYVHLIVIYIFLLILRGSLIFASRPLLQYLSTDKQPVSKEDALLMTWGGLRGAVGLAMAIQVMRDRAISEEGEYQIEQSDADRLLFYVSGVAFLTLIINATSAPALVHKLGVTATPQARQQLLKMFHAQLLNWSEEKSNPADVTQALKEMLHEAEHEISEIQIKSTGPRCSRGDTVVDISFTGQKTDSLLDDLKRKQDKFDDKDLTHFRLSVELPADNLLGKVDGMVELLKKTWIDEGMAKVVNHAFLNIVNYHYLSLIERGDLRPGSVESEILLTSIRASLSPYRTDLVDYKFIKAHVKHADAMKPELRAPHHSKDLGKVTYSNSFVQSTKFNIVIAVLILVNSLFVGLEEALRDETSESDSSSWFWFVIDVLFTCAFIVEAALKLYHLKCKYFNDSWNCFDFVLVVFGSIGCVLSALAQSKSFAAMEAKTIRLARVLRTLRFLRIFRLWHAAVHADKIFSMELARRMKKVQLFTCFVYAHLAAQCDLVKYFGGNGQVDEENEAEIARCILQSQVNVYRAMSELAETQDVVGKAFSHSGKKQASMNDEMYMLARRKQITEGFKQFVNEAHEHGAISGKEAHAILHPLFEHISKCESFMHDRTDGLVDQHWSWKKTLKKQASTVISFTSRAMHEPSGDENNVRVSLRSTGTMSGFDNEPLSPLSPQPSSFTQPPVVDPPCVDT